MPEPTEALLERDEMYVPLYPDDGDWIVEAPLEPPLNNHLSRMIREEAARLRLERARRPVRDDYPSNVPVWRIEDNPAPMPEPTLDPSVLALDILHVTPVDSVYGQHIRGSFQFFRRNAQNRYSSSTLMRLANAAGEYDDRTRQNTEPSPRTSSLLPVITVASRPMSYDEDTEVKSGGTVGMMITWPDGKALFAVTSGSRRQGIGRRIFERNSNYSGVTPYFWVNTSNVPAQQFLLAMGLTPTGLNGNGAVRYGYSGGEE